MNSTNPTNPMNPMKSMNPTNPMNPTKRLLMISYPFPPNASAGAVRSERFARYLSELGWKITVITIKPRADLFFDKAKFDELNNTITICQTETFDPWLKLLNKKPSNIISRIIRSVIMKVSSFPDHMLFWNPFVIAKGLQLFKKSVFDAIYTTSPPHSTHLSGLILSRITKVPWITDFRDPWTLNALNIKRGLYKLLGLIEKYIEKKVLGHASVVLANTPINRKKLLNAFPMLNSENVIYLPNGWEAFPDDIVDTASNVTSDHKFTIVHAGTFYPKFRPYALLQAVAAWRDGLIPFGCPEFREGAIDIKLLGARDHQTREIVNSLHLDDVVTIHPWVSHHEAKRVMLEADLLWVTLGTGVESSSYVPSKLFEYIAAKKPIIGFFPNGDAASLIRETRTGVVFTSDDPMPVISHIHQMMSDRNKNYNPDTEAIEGYHIKSIVMRLDDVIHKLIDKAHLKK